MQDERPTEAPAELPTETPVMVLPPVVASTRHRRGPLSSWDPAWVTGISTAIYAIATIAFAIVAYFQLKALHHTVALTKQTVDGAELRERPWVAFDRLDTIVPKDETINALVVLKNFGALPAEARARVNAVVRPAALGLTCPAQDVVPPGGSEDTLLQTGSRVLLAPSQATNLAPIHPAATREEMDGVRAGSHLLFVYGHVEYTRPGSSNEYQTRFCWRLLVANKKAAAWTANRDGNTMN